MPDRFAMVDAALEKIRLLFRNTGLAQAVVAINATLLIFLFGGFDPPVWAVSWWSAAVLLAGLRYLLARRFCASCPDASSAALWRRRAIVSTLSAGLLWSSGAVTMMLAEPGYTRLFVALVMAGMVSGAVPLLSSVPMAFRAYAIPVMTAIIPTGSSSGQPSCRPRPTWIRVAAITTTTTTIDTASSHKGQALAKANTPVR